MSNVLHLVRRRLHTILVVVFMYQTNPHKVINLVKMSLHNVGLPALANLHTTCAGIAPDIDLAVMT